MSDAADRKAKYTARLAELTAKKERFAQKDAVIDKKIADVKELLLKADEDAAKPQ